MCTPAGQRTIIKENAGMRNRKHSGGLYKLQSRPLVEILLFAHVWIDISGTALTAHPQRSHGSINLNYQLFRPSTRRVFSVSLFYNFRRFIITIIKSRHQKFLLTISQWEQRAVFANHFVRRHRQTSARDGSDTPKRAFRFRPSSCSFALWRLQQKAAPGNCVL